MKKLIIYLIIFYSISFLGFTFLRFYYRKHFNRFALEEIITTPSQFRDKTNNPCFYSVYGDPDVGKEYVKVNLYCGESQKSLNTLALKAIKKKSVEGVLKELGRINGFNAVIPPDKILSLGNLETTSQRRWYCLLSGKGVGDFTKEVNNSEVLECFYK